MTREEKIDIVLERFYNRFNKYNTKVLTKLGETIKKFNNVTPSEAHILAQELRNGKTVQELNEELSRITGKTINEIYEAFDEIAKDDVEFYKVYYESKNMGFKPYSERTALMYYVNSISTLTSGKMVNIARTTGFTKKVNGRSVFKTLRQTYIDLIDEAVYNVSRGTQAQETAMRKVIKELANSGVKNIDYESGYRRRVDSSVRQIVNDGVSQIFDKIQQTIGDTLGTDGVEISAHPLCALDHLPYQGRRFTTNQYDASGNLIKEGEFEKIQNSLDRPIGAWNCRHSVYRILLDVDEPSYTKKQLNEYKKESLKPIEYEGKTYTKYEATQVQRKLETAIRRNKDTQIIARASGIQSEINKSQQKINQLTRKYNDFSKKAGLQPYKERLSVSQYRKVKIKN